MLDTLDFTGLHHWVPNKLFSLRQEHKDHDLASK